MPMHVGLATGFANHAPIDDRKFVREELAQLTLAEELGFESVWITEHHFSEYSVSPNPLFYLGHLAARTKRMRLGTQVMVVPWHDPVRLTEEIVLLDHVSNGRAIIGFGRGLARMEFEGMRVDQSEARERFDESVGMIMSAMETGYIGQWQDLQATSPRDSPAPDPLAERPGLLRRRLACIDGGGRAAWPRPAISWPADGGGPCAE